MIPTSPGGRCGGDGRPMGQTGAVSDPPRWEGPTSAQATSHPPAPPAWEWESVRALGLRWLAPLAGPAGWLAVAYLLVGMLAAVGFFLAVLTLSAVAFGLAFVFVGVLLVVPTFRVVEAFARAERAMARWAGHEVELREPAPVGGIGLRSVRAAMADPVRWRQVGFVAANLVIAPLVYSVGIFPFAVVAQLVFNANLVPFGALDVGSGASLLVGLPVGVVVIGAGPRVAVWVAERKARIAEWFLGPDRLARAEQRVSALTGQRQEILDAVATERRRIERNLHDGVQQQLVAIGLDLGMAVNHLETDPAKSRELLDLARTKVQGSIGELRQLGRGLHPAILEDRGVDAALSAVVANSPIPISVHVDPDLDLSTDVAETVYFVANEAIANVLKHAKARVASVHVTGVGDPVRVTVHDDGVGGADPAGGTGLAGIRARVNGVDGTFSVTSPPGGPTTVVAELPRRG